MGKAIATAHAALFPFKSQVRGSDREFLPSALEILETPASPVRIALMLTICAFMAVAMVWSFFGRLDVQAVALGKIVPSAQTKFIQPFDPGTVVSLSVHNGMHVVAGQQLMAFDAAEAQAEAKRQGEAANALRAEIVRRKVANDLARAWPAKPLLPVPAIDWPNDVPPAFRTRENLVLVTDITELDEVLDTLQKQIAQKHATRERLRMSIGYQTELIKTLQDRVDLHQASLKRGLSSKLYVYDALQSLDQARSSLASDKGSLLEAEAAIVELGAEKDKNLAGFIDDNSTKLAEAEKGFDDAVQQAAKANTRLARTRLFAPTSGTVQGLAVTTLGQVVATGEQLMTIVPDGGLLQAQVYVSNSDIGFVRIGQDVVVKVDTFPFTRFGSLHGKVVSVANDAIDEQTARRQQVNPTSTVDAMANTSGGPGQPQTFVFPVTVALGESGMKIDGATIPLTPGMTLTAEIKTGDRRIISYLLSPLTKVSSEALRER
jgi:hemolysin D